MSKVKKSYYVDWCAGPSVQIELLSPISSDGGYRMNYTSSFRGTIRPPLSELDVGPKALNPIKERVNNLIGKIEGRPRGDEKTTPTPAPKKDILDDMELLGDQLYTFLIQQYVHAHLDLRKRGLYLEIGMDEDLMNFPWELMYDGDDFLCLKHFVGRFVRSKSPQKMYMHTSTALGSSLEKLSILIISVPKTDLKRGTKDYDSLPGAEAETNAIFNLLDGIENVTVRYMKPKEATFDEVFKALKREKYHILHFCGHAHFDDQHPSNSGLVLLDKIMQTGQIANTIRSRRDKKPPILCFINACETTRSVEKEEEEGEEKRREENRLNIYGLARAFLDTGTYLLGSRWEVEDDTAKGFAKQFYTSLIKDGKSIGESIFDARKASKAAFPADVFGWATYIYYGDPRLYFRKAF